MKYLVLFLIIVIPIAAQDTIQRQRAFDAYNSGNYRSAAPLFKAIVEENEKDAEAWQFLGMSYARIKKKDDARAAFLANTRLSDLDREVKYDSKLQILSKDFPKMSPRALANRCQGIVRVAVEFRRDGTIGFVFPLEERDCGLFEPSIKAAKSIKFKPATRNGSAVTVIKIVEYSFDILSRRTKIEPDPREGS